MKANKSKYMYIYLSICLYFIIIDLSLKHNIEERWNLKINIQISKLMVFAYFFVGMSFYSNNFNHLRFQVQDKYNIYYFRRWVTQCIYKYVW